MKKNIILIALMILGGCSTLEKYQGKPSGIQVEETIKKIEFTSDKLPQTKISVANGGNKIVLGSIRDTWEKSIIRTLRVERGIKTTDLYLGEYLQINNSKIKEVTVAGKNLPSYQLEKRGEKYSFRSIFQREFPLELTWENGEKETLVVNNISKYSFDKEEVYNEVISTYNNKFFEESILNIDLFVIGFDDNAKECELNILLINIYIETMRYLDAERKINSLKGEKNLTESQVVSLFKAELKINNYNYMIDEFYFGYGKRYSELSNEIVKFLSTKKDLTEMEYQYLIDESAKKGDKNLEALAIRKKPKGQPQDTFGMPTPEDQVKVISADEAVGTVQSEDSLESNVIPNGNDNKNYENGKRAYRLKRYQEAIVYFTRIENANLDEEIDYFKGNSYFSLGEYKNAIDSYTKYLEAKDDGIKKAESIYNIGFSYEKLGDKVSALNWYQSVIAKYPGTTWERKAKIAVIRLKK